MSIDIQGYATVEDVIKELQNYPKDMIVKIMDSEANVKDILDISEGSDIYRTDDELYFFKFVVLKEKR